MASEPSAEHSPLLQETRDYDAPSATSTTSRHLAIAIPCFLLIAAFEVGGTLMTIPMNQIQEGIICRSHYPDVAESSLDPRCKTEDVQSELSMLQGWELTFGLIPGLFTAVPYGIAADKYGRRVILALSLLGVTLMQAVDMVIYRFPEIFPLRLIWLAAMFTLVGGGPFVFSAMIFAIANDVSTEAQRSTTFFYLAATTLGGELISGPLAYIAMARGPWFSALIGLACLSTTILISFTFPETRGMKAPVHRNDNIDDGGGDSPSRDPVTHPKISTLKQAALSIKLLFLENKRLGLLLFSLIFTTLGRYVSVILMQYTTKRFGWSWSEAGLLSSVSAFVNLILVAAILPLVSQVLLVKLRLSPVSKDLWLVRVGIVALVTGAFGIGLASSSPVLIASIMIFALGNGYAPSMRSLLALVAGDRHIGMLFTTMSVLENIGTLIAGPLMAATFRIGLRWGGSWIGLPFISAGCLLTCAAIIVFSVQLRDAEQAKQDAVSDDGN